MEKIKVLFVCIHNSARSQMAEAFLKLYGRDKFEVESAGIEPGKLNPIVVEVMLELGIDILNNKTKDVNDFIKRGSTFNYVITVCDETSAERCPMFPGKSQRLHWGFRDPSSIPGSKDEKLKETRIIRDEISKTVEKWVKSFSVLS
jgi:arsenate reductase (thioredoxin)